MTRKSGRITIAVGLALAALTLAACDEEALLVNDVRLVGTWSTGCFTDNPGVSPYTVEDFIFTATGWTLASDDYAPADSTCSGTATPADSGTGNYITGGTVQATFGGGTVTANTIDVHAPGVVPAFDVYTIYYIDEVPNPDVLYLGDETATPGLDGSSPAARPTVLQDWKPRPKVP